MDNKNYINYYVEYFFEMLIAERDATQNTILSYRNDINDLHKYLKKNNIELTRITQSTIQNFIINLTENNLSSKTIGRKISAYKQFFLFLVLEGYLKESPISSIVMPKRAESIPKALSSDNINKIIEIIAQDKTKEGIRNYALLEILYSTGMRISELVSLEMKSLESFSKDSDTNLLIIKGKGKKERAVILNYMACEALKKYLKIRKEFLLLNAKSNWVFPSVSKDNKNVHISRQRFGQVLKEIAPKCNIDPAIISPHKIRHSFATHMLDNGANLRIVQELLGHSDISSTQIYTKVSGTKAKKLLLDKHPLGGKVDSKDK